MKRRWIIRSVFVGLLLLCVGGWIGSYRYEFNVNYSSGIEVWNVQSNWGSIRWRWWEYQTDDIGLRISTEPASRPDNTSYQARKRKHLLGFSLTNTSEGWNGSIPFWFATTLSAGLLWLAWRKTRPKPAGSSFPVGSSVGGKMTSRKG